MARMARVVVPGYPHHVTQSGNRRQKTFFCDTAYIFLATEKFVEKMQAKLPGDQDISEVPKAQSRRIPKSLADYHQRYPDRDLMIYHAYASGGYSLKAIGDYVGLHYSRVNRLLKKGSARQKARPVPDVP